MRAAIGEDQSIEDKNTREQVRASTVGHNCTSSLGSIWVHFAAVATVVFSTPVHYSCKAVCALLVFMVTIGVVRVLQEAMLNFKIFKKIFVGCLCDKACWVLKFCNFYIGGLKMCMQSQ